MRPYSDITEKILVEVRDRHMNEVLWTYEDVIGVGSDKYYFYIHTTKVDGAIKLSKRSYRLGIRREI